MKTFFGNHGTNKAREHVLRAARARRLVSYRDPGLQRLVAIYRTPPPEPARREK